MKYKVYDKAKWHYGAESFPTNLPRENGATHIAFFLRWCIENNFISKELLELEKQQGIKQIQNIKDGKTDCREYFLNFIDGTLSSEELNTKGKKFANAYYSTDKTKFAKNYGFYCSDVDNWAKAQDELVKKGNDNAYLFMENNEKTYLIFKKIIDKRYDEFLLMKENNIS